MLSRCRFHEHGAAGTFHAARYAAALASSTLVAVSFAIPVFSAIGVFAPDAHADFSPSSFFPFPPTHTLFRRAQQRRCYGCSAPNDYIDAVVDVHDWRLPLQRRSSPRRIRNSRHTTTAAISPPPYLMPVYPSRVHAADDRKDTIATLLNIQEHEKIPRRAARQVYATYEAFYATAARRCHSKHLIPATRIWMIRRVCFKQEPHRSIRKQARAQDSSERAPFHYSLALRESPCRLIRHAEEQINRTAFPAESDDTTSAMHAGGACRRRNRRGITASRSATASSCFVRIKQELLFFIILTDILMPPTLMSLQEHLFSVEQRPTSRTDRVPCRRVSVCLSLFRRRYCRRLTSPVPPPDRRATTLIAPMYVSLPLYAAQRHVTTCFTYQPRGARDVFARLLITLMFTRLFIHQPHYVTAAAQLLLAPCPLRENAAATRRLRAILCKNMPLLKTLDIR